MTLKTLNDIEWDDSGAGDYIVDCGSLRVAAREWIEKFKTCACCEEKVVSKKSVWGKLPETKLPRLKDQDYPKTKQVVITKKKLCANCARKQFIEHFFNLEADK